jgi:hypothetical protein
MQNQKIDITYKINAIISTDDFIDILNRSTLGERRPITSVRQIKAQ